MGEKTGLNRGVKIRLFMGTMNKTNKMLLFIINIFAIAPILTETYSLVSFVIAFGILLACFYAVVVKSSDALPASAYLTTFAIVDFLIWIDMNFMVLKNNFDLNYIGQLFVSMYNNTFYIFLIAVGIILGIFEIKKLKLTWPLCLAEGVVISSVILAFWSKYDGENIIFSEGGVLFLMAFLLGLLLWTSLYEISFLTAPRKFKENILLGIFFFVAILVINITEIPYLDSISEDLHTGLIKLPNTIFAWWRIILFCILLITCVAITCHNKLDLIEFNVDAFLMTAGSALLFFAKVLISSYSVYNWILFIGFVICTLSYFERRINKKRKMRFSWFAYIVIQEAAFLIVFLLLRYGLWMNILLCVIPISVIYSHYDRIKYNLDRNFLWITIVLFIVSEAAAWQWKMCFTKEGFIMLVIVAVVAIITIVIINYPNPNKISPSKFVPIGICICVGLICMTSMKTSIKVKMVKCGNGVSLNVETKEIGNSIDNITYCWKDYMGHKITTDKSVSETSLKIPIEGNALIITTTDSKGRKMKSVYWYSYWNSILNGVS